MRGIRVLIGLALLGAPAVAPAATCPDRAPAAITSAGAAGLECQKAIAKAGAKFLKTKVKTIGKCRQKAAPGACPSAKDTEKVQKAAQKAIAAIAEVCGADTAQAALSSSYAAETDDAVISSCMLSQHAATADVLVGETIGLTSTNFFFIEPRDKCTKELAKQGAKYAQKALKIVNKCIDTQMADAVVGNLAPICVGGYSGGSFVPPSDAKTADKLAKLLAKTDEKVTLACGDAVTGNYIETLFACTGATTVGGLSDCVVCSGWDAVVDAVDHAYAESGVFIDNGPGALALGLAAGTTGTKLLIEPGDYAEAVTVPADGMQMVGCGSHVNDRPRIVRPAGPGPFINGVFATNRSDLLFQGLAFFDFDENGIFVSASDNIVFRDLFADGGPTFNSTYGIFPIQSNGVLIETSEVVRVSDAGIYVGQSSGITMRYNRMTENVAGLEVENSGNANVHNNYTTNNSGGILIFKLPGLPVQLSDCHDIHHNVSEVNDAPNIGSGTVGLVPAGTGMIVLSNDNSTVRYNVARNNGTFGLAVTDQAILDALFDAFGALSPDFLLDNNAFMNNIFINNGGNADPTIAGLGLNLDAIFVAAGGVGNCQFQNLQLTDGGLASLPACGVLNFPSCPAPPVP